MGIKYVSPAAVVNDIASIKYGTLDVDKAILNGNIFWTRALMVDSFNIADQLGLDAAKWMNILNTGDGGGSPYLTSVANGNARMNVPDGLIGLNTQFSHWRWTANVTNGDDGYIETQIGNRGSSDDAALYTGVWRRTLNTNTTTFTAGVGMVFSPAGLLLTSRISSVNVTRYNCGAFSDGDIARLIQTGNVHEVYLNGQSVGVWNDSGGLAAKASTNRSMVVSTSASKAFLGGRRYSASLNYVECR